MVKKKAKEVKIQKEKKKGKEHINESENYFSGY